MRASPSSSLRLCWSKWITGFTLRLNPGVLVALLDDIVTGAYMVEALLPEDYRRVQRLSDRYADSDIGFVNARGAGHRGATG